MTPDDHDASDPDDRDGTEKQIADALVASGRTLAAAESLTGGNVSAGLSAIQGASEWFRGAVVAYDGEVKFGLLGVRRGPVINAGTAEQMARGVAGLLGADFAVATTGVGGPGPQEGRPPGTVYIGIHTPAGERVREYAFAGDPPEVVAAATSQAVRDLATAVSAIPADAETGAPVPAP